VVGVSLVILNLLMTVGGSQGVAVEVHLMGAAYGALYFYRDWRLSELNWQFWRRGPRLQIHAPDDEEDAAEDRQWRQLQEDGDRLLEKINQHGEASLTNKERKTLQRYSEALRKRRR
jgi:hypothetical protein